LKNFKTALKEVQQIENDELKAIPIDDLLTKQRNGK
jgi:hypothetical protein